MIYHGFAPQAFICAIIIPIPKGSKASLTSSDIYRSIAINNVIGKILDHVIIDRLSDCLKTSDYQFRFKSKSSTVLCSTIVNETIQYYIEKGGKRIYLLLLDAAKFSHSTSLYKDETTQVIRSIHLPSLETIS